MNKAKKIKVDNIGTKRGINCYEEGCPFLRTCANHITAGDFRSEDGFTPKLELRNGEVFCKSIFTISDEDEFREHPIGHYSLGCLLGTELVEKQNDYQI